MYNLYNFKYDTLDRVSSFRQTNHLRTNRTCCQVKINHHFVKNIIRSLERVDGQRHNFVEACIDNWYYLISQYQGKMPVATLWFNETENYISAKVADMIEKYICYMKVQRPEEAIIVVVHQDKGHIESLFGDRVQVVKITDLCPPEQLPIYESGNNFATMIDHGKHLIIDWLIEDSKSNQLCAVTDLDIETDANNYVHAKDWFSPKVQEMMNKIGIIDNKGENQAYLFRGISDIDAEKDSNNFYLKVKSLHKSYYIDFLGKKYTSLARKGLLKFNIKRITLGTYIITTHDSETDYGPGSIFDLRYGEIFHNLFGTDTRFDFLKLSNLESSCYIPSTTMEILSVLLSITDQGGIENPELLQEYLNEHPESTPKRKEKYLKIYLLPKISLPFTFTTFSEDGMTTDDKAFATLILGMQKSGFNAAKIRDIIAKGLDFSE